MNEIERTRARGKRRRRSWPRDLLFFAMVAVIAMAARSSLADHYHVPSGSMRPTVEVGDRLLVDKLAYGLRIPFTSSYFFESTDPGHGDVVVLNSPEDGTVLLKRVVAVAGDEVAVRHGRLILNGAAVYVDDTRLPPREELGGSSHALRLTDHGGPDFGPLVIPPRHYLVLGDNRGESHDGRSFGLVGREALLGRAFAIYRRDSRFVWLEL